MIIINQQTLPKALVIWLHGLGADQNDFISFIERLHLNNFMFILPNAPFRKITMNQGYEMRGWYDIDSLNFKTQDNLGLNESKALIESIIQSKYNVLNRPKLFIGGFSQGAALAQYIGLNSKFEFTKIISLSGYLPDMVITENKSHQKILAIHGVYDDIININIAKSSYEKYKINKNFVLKEYKMGHEVIEEEIFDVRNYLLSD
jgi:predicted esterase